MVNKKKLPKFFFTKKGSNVKFGTEILPSSSVSISDWFYLRIQYPKIQENYRKQSFLKNKWLRSWEKEKNAQTKMK